jgi:hypothetical protein
VIQTSCQGIAIRHVDHVIATLVNDTHRSPVRSACGTVVVIDWRKREI